jgi:hypothetical protein
MDNGVEALVGFVGTHGDGLNSLSKCYSDPCASHKTRGAERVLSAQRLGLAGFL